LIAVTIGNGKSRSRLTGVRPAVDLRFAAGRAAARQVRARAEAAALAGQDHGARTLLGRDRAEGVGQLASHVQAGGVEGGGIGEGDDGHAVGGLEPDLLVGHGVLPRLCRRTGV
jgi:hypothetical protein